jgi:hypothetical protein
MMAYLGADDDDALNQKTGNYHEMFRGFSLLSNRPRQLFPA